MLYEVSDETRKLLETIPISNAFYEGRFSAFQKYCSLIRPRMQLEIFSNVGQLVDFNFDLLYNAPGIGVTKVKYIVERYIDIVMAAENGKLEQSGIIKPIKQPKPENPNSYFARRDRMLFTNMHETVVNEPISFLQLFKIRYSTIKILESANIKTIGNLRCITLGRLRELCSYGYEAANHIAALEPLFENHLFDVYKEYLNQSIRSNSRAYEYCKYRGMDKTFDEISQICGFSRAYIQQITYKFSYKLMPIIKSLFRYCTPNKFVTTDFLKSVFINDDFYVIKYALNTAGLVEYLYFADMYIMHDKLNISDTKVITDTITEKDYYEMPNKDIIWSLKILGYTYITNEHVEKILLKNGYFKYGNKYMLGSKSSGYLLEMLLDNYFPNGVRLDTTGVDALRAKYKEVYDTDLTLGVRHIENVFRTKHISCDKSTFISSKHVYIDRKLLIKIIRFIDQYNNTQVNIHELYHTFYHDLCINSNITNGIFLRSVIKYYYKDTYDFSSKNYIKKK